MCSPTVAFVCFFSAQGEDQDEMERKRRRQLAERWTQLEEDSVRRTTSQKALLVTKDEHTRAHAHLPV